MNAAEIATMAVVPTILLELAKSEFTENDAIDRKEVEEVQSYYAASQVLTASLIETNKEFAIRHVKLRMDLLDILPVGVDEE